jgi:hypothetical protein
MVKKSIKPVNLKLVGVVYQRAISTQLLDKHPIAQPLCGLMVFLGLRQA